MQRPEQTVGEVEDVRVVGGRDAEHVADHDERQLRGEVVAEVALPALAEPVDQAIGERTDPRLVIPDPRRREAPVHELAALGVVGRILVHHPRHRPALHPRALGAGEHGRVPTDGADALPGDDTPHAVALVTDDRRDRAQLPVDGPGPGAEERGVEEVEVGRGDARP